jgi:hypothetical protein
LFLEKKMTDDPWCIEQCQQPELRYRVTSGSQYYAYQCLTCGRECGRAKKTSAEVSRLVERTLFDETIQPRYREWRKVQYQEQRAAVREQRAAVQEQDSREWHERYDAYRQTATWQNVRRKVLERDARLCQACRNAEATQVHHLTYERVFNEALFDLVSVCQKCHETIHGENKA